MLQTDEYDALWLNALDAEQKTGIQQKLGNLRFSRLTPMHAKTAKHDSKNT